MLFSRLTKVRIIPYGIGNRSVATAILNYCKPNICPIEPAKDAIKEAAKEIKKEASVKEAENVVAAMNAAKEAAKEITKEAAKVSAPMEVIKPTAQELPKEAAAKDAVKVETAKDAIETKIAKQAIKDAEKVTATMEAAKATSSKEVTKEATKVTSIFEASNEKAKEMPIMEAAAKKAADDAIAAAKEAANIVAAMEAAREAANEAAKKAAKEAAKAVAAQKAASDAIANKVLAKGLKESTNVTATMDASRMVANDPTKKTAKATLGAKHMAATMKASKDPTKDTAKMGATMATAKTSAPGGKKSGSGGAKEPPKQPAQPEKKTPKWKDFRVYRWNPEEPNKPAGLQTFKLDLNECGHMVLDALFKIKNDIDPTFTFRRSCREGICGSCSMNINGVNTLACTCAIDQSSKPITVYPLPHMYVVRDLVVDMTQFYDQYHYIEPWLQRNDEDAVKKSNREIIQAPDDRIKVDMPTACILCACCTTACPTYWWHNDKFLGPAAILNAYRWVVDSRDQKTTERLEKMSDKFKVLTCHSIWNCTRTCPKGLNPAETVHRLRLMIIGMSKKETPIVPKDDYKPKTLAELKEK